MVHDFNGTILLRRDSTQTFHNLIYEGIAVFGDGVNGDEGVKESLPRSPEGDQPRGHLHLTPLNLLDPNSDQVARDIVAFGECVERIACNKLLSDLPLEFDAVRGVFGHGVHPLKARQPRSIPNLQSVHRQGRIPGTGQF